MYTISDDREPDRFVEWWTSPDTWCQSSESCKPATIERETIAGAWEKVYDVADELEDFANEINSINEVSISTYSVLVLGGEIKSTLESRARKVPLRKFRIIDSAGNTLPMDTWDGASKESFVEYWAKPQWMIARLEMSGDGGKTWRLIWDPVSEIDDLRGEIKSTLESRSKRLINLITIPVPLSGTTANDHKQGRHCRPHQTSWAVHPTALRK